MKLWAQAVASGVDDALYWSLTPRETTALLAEITKIRRHEVNAENLRAGVIAAAVYNAQRSRGQRVKPTAFFQELKETKVTTAEGLKWALDGWAKAHNRRFNA